MKKTLASFIVAFLAYVLCLSVSLSHKSSANNNCYIIEKKWMANNIYHVSTICLIQTIYATNDLCKPLCL